MLIRDNQKSKILITTPDYPPKLGGLSTFTQNISQSLDMEGFEHDIFHWKSAKPFSLSKNYSLVINIHFMGGFFCKSKIPSLNFVHGSEILFYSPVFFKRLLKKLLKGKLLTSLEKSYWNFFISDFTLNKTQEMGLRVDYARDMVIHNNVSLEGQRKIVKNIDEEELRFVCVARDVPHKNISGAYSFLRRLSKMTEKKIIFYVTSQRFKSEGALEVKNISHISDKEREGLYQKSHFNILFSLDCSKKGFFEGFGLTVLEAGKYATPSLVLNSGGLAEAVHHKKTGWVFNDLESESVHGFFSYLNVETYRELSENVYQHTVNDHGLEEYQRLFRRILPKVLL